MAKIANLSASQLSEIALKRLFSKGITNEGFRIIYHALVLDENNAKGLGALSAYLNKHKFEQLSGGILEYACSDECPISKEAKVGLEDMRFKTKWSWGFSYRKDGQKWLRITDFENWSDFVVEEERYQKWLEPLLKDAGSLKNIVLGAHTLLGITGNLLKYKEGVQQQDINDIFYQDKFERTPFYDEWLRTSLEEEIA